MQVEQPAGRGPASGGDAQLRFTDLADALVAREHITYGEACRRIAAEHRELYAAFRAVTGGFRAPSR